MQPARANTLYRGEDFFLADWLCSGCDSEAAQPEVKSRLEVVFVRKGMFVAESREGSVALTPNEVWIHPPGVPYRVSHPEGRDECTVITLTPALEECYALRGRRFDRLASARTFRTQHQLWAALSNPSPSSLAVEESVFELLDEVMRPVDQAPVLDGHRRVVRRVQELLAARFARRLSLRAIARVAGVSPYHLSRMFRRVTGETVHAYQTSLRLREGLRRLSEGESNLTTLALDLGFSDHSHFTNSFRRAFGRPPSEFRLFAR